MSDPPGGEAAPTHLFPPLPLPVLPPSLPPSPPPPPLSLPPPPSSPPCRCEYDCGFDGATIEEVERHEQFCPLRPGSEALELSAVEIDVRVDTRFWRPASGKKEEPAPGLVKLRSLWEVPVLALFLRACRRPLRLSQAAVTLRAVEQSLLLPGQDQFLDEIHTKLLLCLQCDAEARAGES